jgi:putative spermidine/putrescine transport system permease protein
MVSFWRATDYELIPAFTLQNYADIFSGCGGGADELCVTFKTYLSTLKFCLLVWGLTLADRLHGGLLPGLPRALHAGLQTVLFIVCTVPSGPAT